MNNILKGLSVTTITIFYLFFCGALYLTSFWNTFNVNITNLVNITDIPKSFVIPIVWTESLFFLFLIINANLLKSKTDSQNLYQLNLKIPSASDYLLLLTIIFLIILYPFFKTNFYYWIFPATIFAFVISTKLSETRFLRDLMPYKFIRLYTCMAIVFLPFLCVAIGKKNSLEILKNERFNFVNLSKDSHELKLTETTQLKLLDFLGDKIVVSTLDNKQILFINQSAYEIVTLTSNPDSAKKSWYEYYYFK